MRVLIAILLDHPSVVCAQSAQGLPGRVMQALCSGLTCRIIPRNRRDNGSPSEALSAMPGSPQSHFTIPIK